MQLNYQFHLDPLFLLNKKTYSSIKVNSNIIIIDSTIYFNVCFNKIFNYIDIDVAAWLTMGPRIFKEKKFYPDCNYHSKLFQYTKTLQSTIMMSLFQWCILVAKLLRNY